MSSFLSIALIFIKKILNAPIILFLRRFISYLNIDYSLKKSPLKHFLNRMTSLKTANLNLIHLVLFQK